MRKLVKDLNNRFMPPSDQVALLLYNQLDPERFPKIIVVTLGILFGPLTFGGMLIGYVRGYNRFIKPKQLYPSFKGLTPIVKLAMALGVLLTWSIFILAILGLLLLYRTYPLVPSVLATWLGFSAFCSIFIYAVFRRWRSGIVRLDEAKSKYGTAKFASKSDLLSYTEKKGIYIGGKYYFDDKGHILTVAGTRGGKGTNLIIPNLLGKGNYQGTWVVIDPKGENASITARYQREVGKNVVVLNPWGLFEQEIGKATSYNPLDILSDRSSIHLVDDVAIIAEMLVPKTLKGDSFFTDNARSIISTLLLYLVTLEEEVEDEDERTPKTLTTLWKWLRYDSEEWNALLLKICGNDDDYNGLAIRTGGNEILKLMSAGEKTYGSIMATCLQSTTFLNSPSLQASLVSDFDPRTLVDGKTSLYVIIPADKLQSHSRWLRLVVISMLRAVIRKPNKKVTFILDELAALGYISEIENALSTYGGYNVTIWSILQSLVQLQSLYKDNWETFTANTTIKQYFSVNDNFTAEYVSKAAGAQTNLYYDYSYWGDLRKVETNPRSLITPDEVRRGSGEYIFMFAADKPITDFAKYPYYYMADLQGRFDDNPYFKKPDIDITPLVNYAKEQVAKGHTGPIAAPPKQVFEKVMANEKPADTMKPAPVTEEPTKEKVLKVVATITPDPVKESEQKLENDKKEKKDDLRRPSQMVINVAAKPIINTEYKRMLRNLIADKEDNPKNPEEEKLKEYMDKLKDRLSDLNDKST